MKHLIGYLIRLVFRLTGFINISLHSTFYYKKNSKSFNYNGANKNKIIKIKILSI